jgi:LysM repeat protein
MVTPTPAPAPAAAPAKSTHTKTAKAPKAPKAEASASEKPAKTKAVAKGSYTVKKGDTLAVIAKSHKTTIKKIKALNPGLNPDRIYVGQKLKMP